MMEQGRAVTGSGELAARMVHGVKTYGMGEITVRALDDVTVGFGAGRFTSIMGPSGSGKSTLLNCLAGLDELTSGEVWVGGINLASLNERERTRARRSAIGFVFQSYNLVPTLSARENVLLPEMLAGTEPDPRWFDEVIERFALGDRLDHHPSELSGGQQQRVAVARALVARPQLILADEPTGNLDSHSGAEVLGLLRQAVDELGQSVVMVTHDPTAAARSDRVVFLADGGVVAELDGPTTTTIFEQMAVLT